MTAENMSMKHCRCEEVEKALDAARALADELAEALLPLQWSYADDIGNYGLCPDCLEHKKHKVTCAIGAVLAKWEASRG